jgi:hypothetical protein
MQVQVLTPHKYPTLADIITDVSVSIASSGAEYRYFRLTGVIQRLLPASPPLLSTCSSPYVYEDMIRCPVLLCSQNPVPQAAGI